MNGYYCGCAKVFSTEQIVLVKAEGGFLEAGDIVNVSAAGEHHVAGVLCAFYVTKGSADETVMLANSTVYDVEEIYRRTWRKEEEKGNAEELE